MYIKKGDAMYLDILTLLIIGIFGFLLWKDRERSKDDLIRNQETFKDDLKDNEPKAA